MEAIRLDVTTVVAIWMVGVVVLVPLLGLTLRFGFAPFLESLARARAAWREGGAATEAAERLGAVEAQLAELTRAVERLPAREPANV